MCWAHLEYNPITMEPLGTWIAPCSIERTTPATWRAILAKEAPTGMLLCAVRYVGLLEEVLDHLYAELEKRTEENP